MLRPEQVALAAVLEGGGVEREGFPARLQLAALDPLALEGIGGGILEDVDADVPDLLGLAGGEVDEPFAIDVIDLGRPDVRAHDAGGVLAPDDFFLGGDEPLDRGRASKHKAVVLRHRAHEVVVPVVVFQDVRVGALEDEGIGQVRGVSRID